MGGLARRVLLAFALFVVIPAAAFAQTSAIAGVVKDGTGAVLPGVTVEASSPALIEKTRSALTDASGQFKITSLRPGVYSISFTLPGFSVVKREGIELTSDFTATIGVEMKVGAVEETITVSGESPVVDVQNVTTRTVMTRDVLDTIPTGRNIQAVGIMIPGTSIALGGGGALSRDVGGSGNLQQSPLQYRGSPDTVQTIDGLRLNNLCANGAYSGVYWNDGSFQEFSYVTGADSAEMGQGGMRVNMVPKDGGNTFHGVVFGNYAPNSWASDNCGSPGLVNGVAQPCSRSELSGDTTFNPNNRLTNVGVIQKVWDFNAGGGGPIAKDKAWFYFTFRHWGVNKTVADSFFDLDASPFKYVPDTSRPAIDDGHIVSGATRVAYQMSSKDKLTTYFDDQRKYRPHWGVSSTVPPEAAGNEVTPTSFVSVTKWTRTHTNKLLLEGGFAVYDQEYTELYQPSVTGSTDPVFDGTLIAASRVYTISDNSTGKIANAWNAPADHFSKLFTEQIAASYVTGAHAFRFGANISQAKWRLVSRFTGDAQPITYSAGAPVSITLRLPSDRSNSIKNDSAVFAQDKWTYKRATINAGLRWDWFISSVDPESLPASTLSPAISYSTCSDGKNNLNAGCVGQVTNWKDLSPRLGIAYDLFGNGKTAIKASVARYVNGVGLAGGSITDNNNPEITVLPTDTRAWKDLDGNGSPYDANGNLQLTELTNSPSTVNFGKSIPSTTTTDPAVLSGWGARAYNWEYVISASHELAPRMSVSGGWFRRKYGNQTITVDNRFSIANGSYDGPFCANAPVDPNLPNGGGYQVCGLYNLKPSVVAQNLPASNTLSFSSNYGGETNIYEGFDLSVNARPKAGMFIQGGITAGKRIFDQCAMVNYGVFQLMTGAIANTSTTGVSENYSALGSSPACHQDLPYRPDFKLLGSYTLPLDVILSGTFQFVRGVQNGGGTLGFNSAGAPPSIQAAWSTPAAATTLGRAYSSNSASEIVNLIPVGYNYGNENLKQLDLRVSKRVKLQKYRVRVDFDAYNVFNSNWPFTVSSTFSTSATTATWLRPTNVLQSRFYKVGLNFEF
jgi:hypothetical protein